ncbi:MAG: SMP-30/gluconolactonase/LRE family protein [Alphaproteobacteria bacterium]|nr:SMP-30/gluconolactonase/LRE family protein [Alphaproteobacteria bacterium]
MQYGNGISRRHLLAGAAGGLAIASGIRESAAQAAKPHIERFAPELDAILDAGQPVLELATGFGGGGNTEGPVWWSDGGFLLFSSIGEQRIIKYTPGQGTGVYREKTNGANGNTRDMQGRLVSCQGLARRLTREEKDGSTTVICNTYQGKRINKPNDVVVKSDGSIYFTDPWNIPDLQQAWDLDYNGVYRVSPDLGSVNLLTRDLILPNGLAFSHDEKVLYIGDSRRRSIFAFDVAENGMTLNQTQRLFVDLSGREPGGPDGFKVDQAGNLYTGGSGGIYIVSPEGKKLGRIVHGAPGTTNIAFGGADWRTLYFTTRSTLGSVNLKAPGVPVPALARKV